MARHAKPHGVRSHPVVGTLFILIALALFVLGAVADRAPPFLERAPLPPEIVVPFILWQVAVWATLLGVFFLRPRGPVKRRTPLISR